MIWWILLAILVLILILPLGVRINYDEDGAIVCVLIRPFHIQVFPVKKKEKPKKKEPKEEPKEEQPKEEAVSEPVESQPKSAIIDDDDEEEETEPSNEKKGGSLTDFLPLVELALKFVGEFFGKTLHIDVLYLKMTMAGGDPADLAINYGRTWAALGNLWPHIDKMFTIKKRDIQLQCDFEGSQTLVNARVEITITLARLLGLVFHYGFRIGVRFLKIMFARNKAAKAENKNA
jgi:hypothetical protein